MARLNELTATMTESMDSYKLLEPTRAIRDFVGDLSTWYLRRSRDRIKEGESEAKATLYFVLKTLAKLMAPFAPFTAEDLWQKLKNENDIESVHLEKWPESSKENHSGILKNMRIVRDVVSKGLEARQREKIPVRQPLSKIEIKNYELGDEFIDLVKDELNVKEVALSKPDDDVLLYTEITPELKAEGEYREFMRELQDNRKKLGLNPGDKMTMSIGTIYKKYKIMPQLQEHMFRVAAVALLICENFEDSLPKEDIVTACLLHDMGKI